MRSPFVRLALAALLVFVAVWVAACSKDSNKGTNPPPAGSELNSGGIAGGVVFQHTFASAGTYPYHCTIHSAMTGTVTVDAGSANDSAFVAIVSMTSTGFSPQGVTIKPGGHVRWLNNPGQPTHTVTSN